MKKITSDSELSIDSLEDDSRNVSKINPHGNTFLSMTSTKNVNGGKIIHDKETLGNKTKVGYTSEDKFSKSAVNIHFNNDDKRNISSKGSDIYHCRSYFFGGAPGSQSARIPSIRRVSRRQSLCFETPETQRIRHRSVSYLELFKKKHSTTTDIDLTASTTLCSEVTSQRCASVTTINSVNKVENSDLEFQKDSVINNEDSNVSNSKRDENKHTCKVVHQKDRKGVSMSKERKVQSSTCEFIQPKRDVRNYVQDHLEKRKALERREEYSKKVQLRNQIKANRQKEMDKAIKFKNQSSPRFRVHHTLPPDSIDIGVVPFLINQLDLSATARSDSYIVKTITKPDKTKTKTKNQKSSSDVCNLSMLQKRHESEKTAVNSIRNSFNNIRFNLNC